MHIVGKVLTLEDVEMLNASKNSIVILPNTAGQSLEVLRQIAPHVKFQIIGGYDGEKKRKYKEARIQKRTNYTPSEVCSIIERYEELEKGIDPNWSDFEKAIYVYIKLGENILYQDSEGVDSYNLKTILGKGVCAGYASSYKEAMDRLGIECDIVNKPRKHTWNALTIDGTKYLIDLTWDAQKIQKEGIGAICWFGQNPNFNKFANHEILGEEVVPNNCFDEQALADAINKVTNGNHYVPVQRKEFVDLGVINNVLIQASQGNNVDEIRAGSRAVAEILFDVEKKYHESAFIEDVDTIYNNIFQAIKENKNLTDEQKQVLLQSTNNFWSDVIGIHHNSGVKDTTRKKIKDLLNLMNYYVNGEHDQKLSDTQLKEIYNKCLTHGVLDIDKLQSIAEQLRQQVAEMKDANNNNESIDVLKSKIKLDLPSKVIEAEPAKGIDWNKYLTSEIAGLETFINGIVESGADINDPETQDILSACNIALQSLISQYQNLQYANNHQMN